MRLGVLSVCALTCHTLLVTTFLDASDLHSLPSIVGPRGALIARSVRELPSVLDGVALECDWGLHPQYELRIRLSNQSGRPWHEISARGGCSCLKIEVEKGGQTTIEPGASVTVHVVYSRPSTPGMSPRTIRLLLNESPVELPLLVDWLPPVQATDVRQTDQGRWQLDGKLRHGWSIEDAVCRTTGVEVISFEQRGQSFSVQLNAEPVGRRTCRLEFRLAAPRRDSKLDYSLAFPLQPGRPRSIPRQLVCRLTQQEGLTGQARLVFPGARHRPRPMLQNATLMMADGTTVALSTRQSEISKVAIKVEFESRQAISVGALVPSCRIRFWFDDGSHLDCPFLVSLG